MSIVSVQTRAELVSVWIGTGSSEGIFHAKFDTGTGKLSEPQLAAEIASPGFLAKHPHQDVLYAVGRPGGTASVTAFRVPKNLGSKLTLVNSQPIGDGGAAHVSVAGNGRAVVTAQYGGGSVAVFPIEDGGRLGPRSQLLRHEGGSQVVQGRQESPHPHWSGQSPDGRFLFVPDLGLDQVVAYRVQTEVPFRLTPHGNAAMPAGGGPRHMKFHPSGKWAYVLNELTLAVTACKYDSAAGALTPFETIPALPEETKSREQFNSASEIRVHPSGRFLYTGNRGNDSISVFQINGDGRLARVQSEPIRGAWPRNFSLDPSGNWLIAAGRDSNSLSVFVVDPQSGRLTYVTRSVVNVPAPICVLIGN